MTGEPPGPSGFAIGNDEQYRPVQAVGPEARARGSAELTRLHTMRS
jgi:Ni,Fe-hydrogenase III large subunit